MSFAVFDFPWWGYVLASLLLTHVTIVSVTVYLHRSQAHSALDLGPGLAHFFRFWLWLTTGIVTKQWVAVHRKHHATVETDDDPHSPQKQGINAVLWGGWLLYRKAASQQDTLNKFGKGTPDDWLEQKIYARHPNYGISLLLVIYLLLFGPLAGVLVWIVQMFWIPFWAAGVINGVGHFMGYRNFELPDASRNIVPWGFIIGGEELHNNHHAYASSAQFSVKPWEFDLGWQYVRLFQALDLLKIRRKIPVLAHDTEKQSCDIETAKAFVSNRFEVLARYFNDVLVNVCREEMRSATGEYRKKMKRARKLLKYEGSSLSGAKREYLQGFLETNKRLRKAYAMREALHNIAARSSSSYENLHKSLEEWCRAAEESGIEALRQFSIRLRGYTTVQS